jgi:HEAT repeat protein
VLWLVGDLNEDAAMAESIRCPHCGKTYVMKPELTGKQVRCRQCEKAFTVTAPKPPDDGLDEPILLTVAPQAPKRPAAPVDAAFSAAPAQPAALSPTPSTPLPPVTTAYRPKRRMPKVRSGFTEEGFVWFGVILLTLSILGVVLPRFGLQFKAIQRAGTATYGQSATGDQARQSMAVVTIVFGIASGIVMGIGLRKNLAQAVGAPIGMWVAFAIAFFTSPFSDAFSHPTRTIGRITPNLVIDEDTVAQPPPPSVEPPPTKRIELPEGANDPNHPEFYRVSLAELRAADADHRQFAAMALERAEPKQLRDEITKALESLLLQDPNVGVRMASLKAFCHWSAGDTLPTIIRLLDDREVAIQMNALEILGKRKDPRAVEPVVLLLLKSPGFQVEQCLTEMGSMVETSLIEHVGMADRDAMASIIKLLGTLGTKKGVTKLREIASGSDFTAAALARHALTVRGESVEGIPLPGSARRNSSNRPPDRPAEENGRGKPDAKELDSGQPDYYEKLAKRMQSDDIFERRKAVDRLLTGEPEKAKADTRKQIARTFRDTIKTEHGDDQGKAVRGFALWGGKDGVPTLLSLLDDKDHFLHEALFQALGSLQDERAAVPVAMLLDDFFDHDKAYKCLQRMGMAAEAGLLKVVYSSDPKVCLAAVELMADAGTAKSLPALQTALRSRNMSVRQAAKEAIRRIREREKERKDKDEGAEKGKGSSS